MTDPIDKGPQLPYPPRFWWLKRITIAGLVLIALLVGLRLWWGWIASRRIERELATARALGEPAEPKDFDRPDDLPDSENGAFFLKRAVGAFNSTVDSPSNSNLTLGDEPPFPSQWYQMTEAAMKPNLKAMADVREARRHKEVDWKRKVTTVSFLASLNSLTDVRGVANVLGDVAMLAHLQGNDREAVERIEDILYISWACDQQPSLLAHMISLGLEALALDRLQVIGPALNVNDSREGAATTQQLRNLIQELVDEKSTQRATMA